MTTLDKIKKVLYSELIFFLIFILSSSLRAQGLGVLEGRVLSVETGYGIADANVVLLGTNFGVTSGEKGYYRIHSIPIGSYQVQVSIVGYETITQSCVIKAGQTTHLDFPLRVSPIKLPSVEVKGDRLRSAEDTRISIHDVQPLSIKRLPGVGEDVLRALHALPGVLSQNDFNSRLIVRGSGPDQNLIVMDDVEVFNPYRLYGFISMFNPETISDINLTMGGFSAKYGDRLSAVLDVTNREGTQFATVQGNINTSISNANIVLDGHLPFEVNGSWLLSMRRTYYDLIVGPFAKRAGLLEGDAALPNFYDLQSKIALGPFKKHKVLFNILHSRDGIDLVSGPQRTVPDSVNVLDKTYHNILAAAWHFTPSEKLWNKFVISFYENTGDNEFGGAFLDPSLDRKQFEGQQQDTVKARLLGIESDRVFQFQKYSVKNEFFYRFKAHEIETGVGIDFLKTGLIFEVRLDPELKAIIRRSGFAIPDKFENIKNYSRLNLYLQDKWQWSSKIILQTGVRLDYYSILRKTYTAPRFNLSYAIDDITTLRTAWGIYYQSPGYEKLLDQQGQFFDLTNAEGKNLKAEKAVHYILGLERWVTSEWAARVEGYYKKFNDIILMQRYRGTNWTTEPLPGRDRRYVDGWKSPYRVPSDSTTNIPVNGGYGSSYGIEFMIEKRFSPHDETFWGWLSYGLAWAEMNRYNRWLPFRFDQRHTVNIVLNWRAYSWLEIGAHWRYGSNFPFTPAVSIRPRIIEVETTGQTFGVIAFDPRDSTVIFDIDRGGDENRFSGRLPAYHRLDVRATAYTTFWGLNWSFYLDVINVYNRKNVLNYNYYIEENLTIGKREITMFPIIPTLGLSVKF